MRHRWRDRLWAALVFMALPGLTAVAQDYSDYVVTQGRLTDEAFYRLVACGAAPGGECRMPYVRWPATVASRLRVRLEDPPPGYPPDLARAASDALDRAIAEINAAGAAVRLVRETKAGGQNVLVRLLRVSDGEPVRGSGVPDLEGELMGAAFVYVWWDNRRSLTEGRILMADDLPLDEVYPVMLEELTQSLGFLNDIRNALYESESVFSEDSNRVMRLGPQDIAALRRHYPKP